MQAKPETNRRNTLPLSEAAIKTNGQGKNQSLILNSRMATRMESSDIHKHLKLDNKVPSMTPLPNNSVWIDVLLLRPTIWKTFSHVAMSPPEESETTLFQATINLRFQQKVRKPFIFNLICLVKDSLISASDSFHQTNCSQVNNQK